MTIASYSVVSRILAEVRRAPAPAELEAPERVLRPGQLLELRRTRCLHRRPFATPLHFWAHALYGLLAARGRDDLFEALALHALCRRTPGEEAAAAIAGLRARVGDPALRGGSLRSGWCMIDREEIASWLGEGRDAWEVAFWLRPDWLEAATPWEPEPEPELEGEVEEPEGGSEPILPA